MVSQDAQPHFHEEHMILIRTLATLGIATSVTDAAGRTTNHHLTKTTTLASSHLHNKEAGSINTGKAGGGGINRSHAYDNVSGVSDRRKLTRTRHAARHEAPSKTNTWRDSMAVARLRGGGAEHEHASTPLLHRRTPVNRRAVPPAEALSRSVPFHLWWL